MMIKNIAKDIVGEIIKDTIEMIFIHNYIKMY